MIPRDSFKCTPEVYNFFIFTGVILRKRNVLVLVIFKFPFKFMKRIFSRGHDLHR